MKTSMQELFERLDFIFNTEVSKEKEWWDMFKKEHLEEEKIQIINAFNEGVDEMTFSTSGINYYNQTYTDNEYQRN